MWQKIKKYLIIGLIAGAVAGATKMDYSKVEPIVAGIVNTVMGDDSGN